MVCFVCVRKPGHISGFHGFWVMLFLRLLAQTFSSVLLPDVAVGVVVVHAFNTMSISSTTDLLSQPPRASVQAQEACTKHVIE